MSADGRTVTSDPEADTLRRAVAAVDIRRRSQDATLDLGGTQMRSRATSTATVTAASMVCVLCAASAQAQVSALPAEVRQRLEVVGPTWAGPDVRHPIRELGLQHIKEMGELFRPLLKAAPKDGVTITQNLSYGPDRLNVLDVYRPSATTTAPIVIFLHGGAFVLRR